jgi:hypothetical protein
MPKASTYTLLGDIMKTLLLVGGIAALAVGLFWVGQGYGLVQWPAGSSMVNNSAWVRYGALLAAAGLVGIFFSRRS